MNIGFIGTGLMGAGMARSLIRKGHHVRIYNRTRAKNEAEKGELGFIVGGAATTLAKVQEVLIAWAARTMSAAMAWVPRPSWR